MSAIDLLAVLGAVGLVVACVALFAASAKLLAATRRLDATVRELNETAGPLLVELVGSTERAAGEVERVEHLLDLSEGIASRVDGTTAAAYRAITTPAIKGAALAEGTRRAARRLGRRG